MTIIRKLKQLLNLAPTVDGKVLDVQASRVEDTIIFSGGEVTSKAVAKIAAKGLKYPERLTVEEIRKVCASALTQVKKDD